MSSPKHFISWWLGAWRRVPVTSPVALSLTELAWSEPLSSLLFQNDEANSSRSLITLASLIDFDSDELIVLLELDSFSQVAVIRIDNVLVVIGVSDREAFHVCISTFSIDVDLLDGLLLEDKRLRSILRQTQVLGALALAVF